MSLNSEKNECDVILQTENIFEKKGKEVIRNGMHLILDRIKFARKYDEKIRGAMCAIEDDDELKASQSKGLIQLLKSCVLLDTSEVLDLVVRVIERLDLKGSEKTGMEDKIVVMLDEKVKKWAQ